MATLEKIRSKSVLLVSVIGVALVLFIITLVDNPFAMFQDHTSIAKVGGQTVTVDEFNRRTEMAQQQMSQQGNQNVDNAILQAQVLQQLIQEKLLGAEYDKLGIAVSDEELTEAMTGNNAVPYVRQWAQQFGVTPAQLHGMIFNPAQYGIDVETAEQMKAAWIQMEQGIESELKAAKFQSLLSGAITANKLDAKALFDEQANTYTITYVKSDIFSVPDSAVTVSDSDMRTLYNESREQYALAEPTRTVTYINLPVVPSPDDRLAAEQRVEDAIVALREQNGSEGLVGMSDFVVNRTEAPEADINPAALRTFLTEAQVNDVERYNNTGTVMEVAKLLGRSQKVNEVTVDMVVIDTNKASVDSVMPLLAKAENLEEVDGVAQAQAGQAITLNNAGLPADMVEKFRNEAVGQFFVVNSQGNATVLARVVERKAPVNMIEYVTASYNVEPSQATYNNLRSQLQAFLDSTATATTFTMENAMRHGLTAMPGMVTPSSPAIGNLNDSRDMVHWVMDAKKGQVSSIFNDDRNSRLSAIALNDIYEDYVPLNNTNVSEQIRAEVLADKKGDYLLSQYQGKGTTLADYAALMKADVDTTTVNFSQMYIPRLGSQNGALAASVMNAKPGTVVGPIRNSNGVIVYQLLSVDESSVPYNQDDYTLNFNRTRGNQYVVNALPMILLGNNKIENRTLKFYTR